MDRKVFSEGDVLIGRDDPTARFTIGETDVLEGVYRINEGFAVFVRIDVLDQNEEYAIVAKDTVYGLVRYDRIIRDASRIKEEDIIY